MREGGTSSSSESQSDQEEAFDVYFDLELDWSKQWEAWFCERHNENSSTIAINDELIFSEDLTTALLSQMCDINCSLKIK